MKNTSKKTEVPTGPTDGMKVWAVLNNNRPPFAHLSKASQQAYETLAAKLKAALK